MSRLFLYVLTSLLAAAQSPPKLFPIAGRVVSSGAGKPNAAIRMALRKAERPARTDVGAMMIGPDGMFRFMVPEGKYTLTAERYGLAPQTYGAASLGAALGVAIIAGPGQSTDSLTFVVHPPSAVSGKVTDEAGEPVENALVQLIIEATFGGDRKAGVLRGWMYTNDLGEYRFSGLGAGKYYLAATGKPWYSRLGEDSTAFAPVYYPNAAEPQSAAPFTIRAGEEFTANLMMRPAAGYRVTLRLPEGGRSTTRVAQLTSPGIQGATVFDRTVAADTSFVDIPSVMPGSYLLKIMDGRKRLAVNRVDVGSTDVPVTIDSVEPPSVSASVEVAPQSIGNKLTSLQISLQNDDARFSSGERVAADNSVKFTSILPDRYRVRAHARESVYVTGLSLAGKTLPDTFVDVPPTGITDLKVIVTKGTARVRGFAKKNGRPEVGVIAVLAPAWPTSDPAHFQGFMTDSDGSFDFEGLLPGKYRLFAVADPDFEYANPAVVRPLMAGATEIEVADGQTVETTVATR